jgi:hypothetical protein
VVGYAIVAIGVLLLIAALVKGGSNPVTWLLFRWSLTKVIVVIGLVVVLWIIGSHRWK